ncbi:hypothetical protein [Ancylobacter amanitiformis]|uniref:DUF3035 domain-containing protein n=1 Tax=Ancylobacter amanitiformis TaxID=217069 RepID=A0ABU0LR31_9HYPH|nr:hypothetical protein [Ancylobacter amanitiformis]MDQ0511048.1 hypothetical protein [Ancylobacter amanitiformis]
MSRQPLTMRAALLSGAFCVAVLVNGSPAFAQEDNFTEQLLTNLGLVAAPPPDIDYRERAPLVVPPTGETLPPPRAADAITQNPNWPKDDDIKKRADAQKVASKPTSFNDRDATRALTPAEIATGTNPNANNITTKPGLVAENNAQRQDWLKPTGGLGFLGWGSKKEEKPIAFAGEPERQTLTDPPVGYQTPASSAAYGTVAERPEESVWQLPDWFDRSQKNNTRN